MEPTDLPVNPPAADRFDALQAERRELDLLIDQGVTFTTPKRSLLRYLSKTRERTFLIQQPYLGTLDHLSREFINMDFSEDRIREDPLSESKRLTAVNARRCARVIAIAVLNNAWQIRLFTGLLARYFLWRITPAKLFQLTLLINTMSNIADFTNSIRLMSVTRTTTPARMEKPGRQPKPVGAEV